MRGEVMEGEGKEGGGEGDNFGGMSGGHGCLFGIEYFSNELLFVFMFSMSFFHVFYVSLLSSLLNMCCL